MGRVSYDWRKMCCLHANTFELFIRALLARASIDEIAERFTYIEPTNETDEVIWAVEDTDSGIFLTHSLQIAVDMDLHSEISSQLWSSLMNIIQNTATKSLRGFLATLL